MFWSYRSPIPQEISIPSVQDDGYFLELLNTENENFLHHHPTLCSLYKSCSANILRHLIAIWSPVQVSTYPLSGLVTQSFLLKYVMPSFLPYVCHTIFPPPCMSHNFPLPCMSHNLPSPSTSGILSSPMCVTQSFFPHVCHTIFPPLCVSHNLSFPMYATQFSSPMYVTHSFLPHMWGTDFYDKLKWGYNLTCIWNALAWWGWRWNVHW